MSAAARPAAMLRETDPEALCPACDARGLELFYEQRAIPVHSCRLVPTLDEALAFPRGELRLGFCPACGFITNTLYDPALQDYSLAYEETQEFSPRFRAFAEGLARHWVERHELHGKRLLEIGCGKGSFLATMCEAGGSYGIGIDPSFVQGRLESEALERLTFLQELYAEHHTRLGADAIVCRHTLEHILPVVELMRLVRKGSRPGTVVLFELPDVLRVLEEGAFWDVYYEHCSYFSPGTLARLFRRTGFAVLELALEYDGQYIVLEAQPGGGDGESRALEEPVETVAVAVEHFRASVGETVARWHETLAEARQAGRAVAVWGAGSKAVSFLTTLGIADEVDVAVDINPYKQGMFIAGTGQRVVAPAELVEHRPQLVIAMNPVYLDEIRAELDRLDLERCELVAL